MDMPAFLEHGVLNEKKLLLTTEQNGTGKGKIEKKMKETA